MKKILYSLIALFAFNPMILAYSNYIYAGGESVGINLESNSILIMGTYSINGTNNGKEAGLRIGDKIVAIDGEEVVNISDLTKKIQNKTNVSVEFKRKNEVLKTNLKIGYEDGIYKTGLYVKDSIMGIGTLTYIDPGTNIFGCLGHEITEKTTRSLFEASAGNIFKSKVTGIVKSKSGAPGEKVANFDQEVTYGNIKENTKKGVFGQYTKDVLAKKMYRVSDDVKTDEASILTVLNNEKVEKFSIKILKVDKKNETKNILFKITDSRLLSKTNGIVQGMSGSPIIQGDNIVGAVTHVVIDKPDHGYGIFITTMLKEGEN
ncbi:MAG: PDZ domain-containing protein [Erysipelotrichaceae bacterium]|nr:PDZ domain-containing protein [Erysipelotrichaceae bacterium]